MAVKKISNINEEIDIKLFIYIVWKNLFLISLFLLIAFVGSYLYLHYTHPVFEAKAIIQLETNEAMKQFLGNTLPEDDLSKKTELLRSATFLERIVNKLPLKVRYYKAGTILNFEQYKQSPYSIEYNVKNPSIYGIPIFVTFNKNKTFEINYEVNNKIKKYINLEINEKVVFPEFDIKLDVIDYLTLFSKDKLILSGEYYFIINNPETLVNNFVNNLQISILNPNARTIQVMFRDQNGLKTSDIVNSIVQEFKQYDVEKKAESINKTLEFIDKQLKGIYDRLVDSETQLEDFKKVNKIDTALNKTLPNYYSRLNELDDEMIKTEMESKILIDAEKKLNVSNIDIYEIFLIISGSEFKGVISTLLNSLQDLLLKKEELRYEVTENSGQIKALNYKIDIQKKMILESLHNIKNNLDVRKSELSKRINNYTRLISPRTDNYNIVEFSRLQRLYIVNEKYYNELIARKAQYSIEQAGYVSQTVVLEYSKTPTVPVWPVKQSVYLAVIGAALLIGLIIVIIKYLFYNEITSFDDIIKYTDRPIIGIIPKYRLQIPVSQLIVDKNPLSIIAESFRVIRTNIQFISNEPGHKIIAITSTISGEGKTFFAINLAGVIAFSNKKVIIVDSDMRKPKIHIGFNVENTHGLSTILMRKDTIENCIRKSTLENLDFITAGVVPPNPSELILDNQMDLLLNELKLKYDFVIIDNPPIGLVTDGMKSLTIADYPIYILKANLSKRVFIQNINRLYEENNLTNLSVVLNAIEPRFSNYGYSNKYRYYHGFSYGYGYGYTYGSGYGYVSSDENDKLNQSKFIRLFKKIFKRNDRSN